MKILTSDRLFKYCLLKRSTSRNFVKKQATKDDFEELKEIIKIIEKEI
ncbi:hypothetical protein [Apilactobacillus xinyiensis]|nr:hypothetical protein [Apilactobacillus xinyiensis]